MTKHQIEHICWREVSWSRPFDLDTVLDVLMSLSTLSPRGAVIWEVRGKDGKVVHLLGADQRYIDKVAQAFRAYGDIQFREISGESRTPIRDSATAQNHQAGAVSQYQPRAVSNPGGAGGDDGGQAWD